MINEKLLEWLDEKIRDMNDRIQGHIGGKYSNAKSAEALAQLRLMLSITGNESLMRLAEKLGVEFSAAKIIKDAGYAEGKADYEPKEPTDEERKKMLGFLYWISGAATFTEHQIEIYQAIRALIEKRTVTQDRLLDWAFKHAAESNVAIIHSDLVSLLAELGISISDEKEKEHGHRILEGNANTKGAPGV